MASLSLRHGRTTNGNVNTPAILTVPLDAGGGQNVKLIDGRYQYASALVQNVGSENMYIRVGGVATDDVYHIKLSPMSQADVGDIQFTDVTACTAAGTATTTAVVFSIQVDDSSHTPGTAY
tara:strand:- start:51 stop:413 length:363 start_codon:yes stop_codon:yes gene_type:complete